MKFPLEFEGSRLRTRNFHDNFWIEEGERFLVGNLNTFVDSPEKVTSVLPFIVTTLEKYYTSIWLTPRLYSTEFFPFPSFFFYFYCSRCPLCQWVDRMGEFVAGIEFFKSAACFWQKEFLFFFSLERVKHLPVEKNSRRSLIISFVVHLYVTLWEKEGYFI